MQRVILEEGLEVLQANHRVVTSNQSGSAALSDRGLPTGLPEAYRGRVHLSRPLTFLITSKESQIRCKVTIFGMRPEKHELM